MKDNMLDYLATKIVSDLRNSVLPEYMAKEIMIDSSGTRLISLIQELLVDSDIEWLTSNLRSLPSECYIWKLSVVTAGKFMKSGIIFRTIKSLWEERTDFEARQELKWRMLDISKEYNAYAWHSIITHWTQWVSEALRYSGGAEHTIGSVIKKLNDKKYPDHKKWIYLAWLPVAADKTQAHEVLSKNRNYLNLLEVDDSFEFLEYMLKEDTLIQPELHINPEDILDALRNDKLSNDEAKKVVKCVNSNYIINTIRQGITDEDTSWIEKNLQRDTNDYVWMLSLFMAHQLISSPGIQKVLTNLWRKRKDISSRWLLLWRVLDISAEYNDPVWEMIMSRWSKWKYDFMLIMGGTAGLCEGIERNLNSSSKPDFKKWVYVTMYTGLDDHNMAVKKITAAKKYLSHLKDPEGSYKILIDKVVK